MGFDQILINDAPPARNRRGDFDYGNDAPRDRGDARAKRSYGNGRPEGPVNLTAGQQSIDDPKCRDDQGQ